MSEVSEMSEVNKLFFITAISGINPVTLICLETLVRLITRCGLLYARLCVSTIDFKVSLI